MGATKRELDRENIKLRSILDKYVESDGMNSPVWEIVNEDAGEYTIWVYVYVCVYVCVCVCMTCGLKKIFLQVLRVCLIRQ